MKLNRAVGIAACLELASCATTRQLPDATSLKDTDWVLIGFQSSTNSTDLNEVHLYDYKMHLDGAGTAQFKFDCNQGTTSWQAKSTGAGKGTLTFGPIAATLELCGAGSIGESLSSDMTRVANYVVSDGNLTLSPAGDGRVHIWDRVD